MIKSRSELKYYLKCDRIALRRKQKKPRITDFIWKYEIILRKYEYYYNKRQNVRYRIFYYFFKLKYDFYSAFLGYSIPPNVFGPGLSIAHIGTIVVNGHAKIGSNCRIHVDVNIGATGGSLLAPILGDNIYIGPGAKIIGNIKIDSGFVIGANSVVNKSFIGEAKTIAGIPAKIISNNDSSSHLVKATELLNIKK